MKITFYSGPNAGKTMELDHDQITIGREPDNTLALETDGVSRYHAVITSNNGKWTITDLGSTNGVKINGVASENSEISDDDVLTIGEHSFKVTSLAGKAPEKEEDVLNKFKAPLFDRKAEKNSSNSAKEGKQGKRLFSNRLYYTIIACIAVMGITTAVKMFSNAPEKSALQNGSQNTEQLQYIVFERVKYSDSNVFRFSMTLDDREAVFTIDDAATERHSKPMIIADPQGADQLRTQILDTGIMQKKLALQPGNRDTITRIVLVSSRNTAEYRIEGDGMPDALSDIISAIDEFAENCGMMTVSRTSEEIQQIAAEKFHKAEDLFANFESDPENLREAISSYRIAVNYLSQYSPRPPMADKAAKQLAKAEAIREKLMKELRFEATRCLESEQLYELRAIYRKMMMLSDRGSKGYDRARRRLFKLDRALSKMGEKK